MTDAFFALIGCEESSLREGFFSRQPVPNFRESNLTTIATSLLIKIASFLAMTTFLLNLSMVAESKGIYLRFINLKKSSTALTLTTAVLNLMILPFRLAK
jgi:hypothetical protein